MANEIVKRSDDIFSISYDAGDDCGAISGIALTNGTPDTVRGKKVVRFVSADGEETFVRYDTRPDLAALVAEYDGLAKARHDRLQALWAAQKAEQDAIDAPLLAAMHNEVDRLVSLIPADHVRVTVTKTGDSDGWPILDYEAEGVKLSWDDVTTVGTASAIRPGAIGAFASERVASISRERLAEIRERQAAAAAAKAEKRAAREKELAETPIPPDALALYRRYHGDPDAVYEDEGQGAAGAVYLEKWVPYIEAQHGMDREKILKLLADASREANYGLNDG